MEHTRTHARTMLRAALPEEEPSSYDEDNHNHNTHSGRSPVCKYTAHDYNNCLPF